MSAAAHKKSKIIDSDEIEIEEESAPKDIGTRKPLQKPVKSPQSQNGGNSQRIVGPRSTARAEEDEVVFYSQVDVDKPVVQDVETPRASEAGQTDVSIVKPKKKANSRSKSVKGSNDMNGFIVYDPIKKDKNKSNQYQTQKGNENLQKRGSNKQGKLTAIDMTGNTTEAELLKEKKRIENLKRLNLETPAPNRKTRITSRRRNGTKENPNNSHSQEQLDDTTEDTERELINQRGALLGKRARAKSTAGGSHNAGFGQDKMGAVREAAKRSADILKVSAGLGLREDLKGLINQLPSVALHAGQENSQQSDIQVESVKTEEAISHGRTSLFNHNAAPKVAPSLLEACSLSSFPNLAEDPQNSLKTKIISEDLGAGVQENKKLFSLSTQPSDMPVGAVLPAKRRGRKPGTGKKAQATNLVLGGPANMIIRRENHANTTLQHQKVEPAGEQEESSYNQQVKEFRLDNGKRFSLSVAWDQQEEAAIKEFTCLDPNDAENVDAENPDNDAADFEKRVAKLIESMSVVFERTQDNLISLIDSNQYNMKKVLMHLCAAQLNTIPKSVVVQEEPSLATDSDN